MNVPLSMTTIKQVYDDLLTASAPIREEKRVHKLAVGWVEMFRIRLIL